MPRIFANAKILAMTNSLNFLKNIQDRIGVVRRKFGRFQAKLPLSGNERRNCPNLRLNPFKFGELKLGSYNFKT